MALVKMATVNEEIKKNLHLKKSDLEMLRDWLKKQPHLPPMSDSELVLFLHSNYYRTEPTKITIDTYFTVRAHVPEFFSGRDPLGSKELREIMKVVSYVPLPGSTPDGYKVLFIKIIDSNPSHYIFINAIKLICMSLELWLYTSGTSLGHIILFDMDGLVFGHAARVSPMIVKKYCYYLQEALPVRLKGIHFMNTVPFVDVIVNMMKPFMKKELMDVIPGEKEHVSDSGWKRTRFRLRMKNSTFQIHSKTGTIQAKRILLISKCQFFLHNSTETLTKFVPIDLLPNDQGGKAGPLNDLWAAEVTKIEEHHAWFQEEEMRKVNENARPDKAKNAKDIFGVEGSFKKLDID